MIAPDPELRSVLGWCFGAVDGAASAERGEAEQPAAARAPRLLEVAAKLEVLPLVGHLVRGAALQLPLWFERVARSMHSFTSFVSTEQAEVAREIGDELAAIGIQAAFRKGTHVAAMYPDRGCRPSADLDLFVRPGDQKAAVGALVEIGFVEEQVRRDVRAYLLVATNALVPMWRPSTARERASVCVDVATRFVIPVLDNGSGGDVDRLLGRGAACDGVPVLSAADLLLDLVVNQYVVSTTLRYTNDLRFQRLTHYLDVALAAAALDDDGWATFDDEVARRALGDAVAFSFGNLLRFDATPGIADRLATRCGNGAADVLDVIGQWDLDEPYRWKVSLFERLVLDELPPDVPRFRL